MKAADMFNVENYGVVVTGGASGLGLAFTEVLAENGARVTMLDISQERLDQETRRLRTTVNAIAPGWFVTNIGAGWMQKKEVQDEVGQWVPLRRVASTEDIKGLALFLASPASNYITGAQIVIDGGSNLGNVLD